MRPGEALEIGVITEAIYVGETDQDLPRWVLKGSPDSIAESLNEYGEMGVSHLQIRFMARDCAELCDQMEKFGAEVGPNLTR
ncbi:unannotated protein [freshwater metagenome]|uniref:Unannotated protein n=1 Tax=freshwater metagenome TaxID=449393 RepID=A0A6J6LCE4_9ZZZZ